MSSWFWKAGLAGVAMVAATAYAVAQMPDHARMHGQMKPGDSRREQMMHGQHGTMTGSETSGQPDARTGGLRHDPGDRADAGG